MQLTKKQDLRYGENSHQEAAFYVENNIQKRLLLLLPSFKVRTVLTISLIPMRPVRERIRRASMCNR